MNEMYLDSFFSILLSATMVTCDTIDFAYWTDDWRAPLYLL